MLKRFYITMSLWFLAICALGMFARGLPNGFAIVIVGILPIGLAFILLLLFYVLDKTVPGSGQECPGFNNPEATSAEIPLIVWGGQAQTYPVEPQHQCNTIRLEPSQ